MSTLEVTLSLGQHPPPRLGCPQMVHNIQHQLRHE
ncbi:hypothetical protein PPTG_24638 [Phytophthora nicotianae INRA-310]|uniref:Uncharacterized protein n=2 Tax=Phytophthora nicotianae TaxID=4792 RepID=W2PCJ7_PHYN3|nr:hypothetical protein PPTG_24638 [Phytophthora nicotianae INRA-310]ETM98365.1 hypothetical protein PPTG_24638 [Phytophthora nicotianae INRA-310]ETO72998.1 hypothetical protein F444_11026 [Phytophthora nicotianae P1976]